MNKNWWYIIALVVVVALLMFVFKDDVGLGPRERVDKLGKGGDAERDKLFNLIINAESRSPNDFGGGR